MKKMSSKLRTALAIDDELFLRYRSMMREVQREHKRLVADQSRIHSVIGIKGDSYTRLDVARLLTTPDGTIVYVRL